MMEKPHEATLLTVPLGTTKKQESDEIIDSAIVTGFPDGQNVAETSVAFGAKIEKDMDTGASAVLYPGSTAPGMSGGAVLSGSPEKPRTLRLVGIHTGRTGQSMNSTRRGIHLSAHDGKKLKDLLKKENLQKTPYLMVTKPDVL